MRDTKKEVFKAALKCFSVKGYERTTIDDIIEVSGVSKGSIYYHFANKKDLFYELFNYLNEGNMETFVKASKAKGTAWDRVVGCFFSFFINFKKNVDVFRAAIEILAVALKEEDFREKQARVNEVYQEILTYVIQEGIDSGEFGITDARGGAFFVYSCSDGAMIRTLLQPEYATEEYYNSLLVNVSNGLKRKES